MEEPDARIVGLEAYHEVACRSHHEGISPHRSRWKGRVIAGVIVAPVIVTPHNSLKVVSVQMERMLARIVIVQDDLYNLVFFQDVAVGVAAIDGHVRGVAAGGQRAVQRRDYRFDVGDLVEEGTVAVSIRAGRVPDMAHLLAGAISKIVHGEIKCERDVDFVI